MIKLFNVFLGIVGRLNYNKHSEAVSSILLMLKTINYEPNMLLLRNLLSRPHTDLFVVHALKVGIFKSKDAL